MANTGKHRYTCYDCNRVQMLHPIAFTRAARVKCVECGSIRLDPSPTGAKAATSANDAIRNIKGYCKDVVVTKVRRRRFGVA